MSSDEQLTGWTEKTLQSTSQSQTCTKKWWSLFGGLLPIWSNIAFWILVKPLHLRSMLSKSMRCMENCNACSWYWSKEWARSLSQQCPAARCKTSASKAEWTGLICRIYLTSSQPTTTSSISTTFCRENASTTSRRQKMLSKSLSNPKAQIFMLQE